ncbi:PKD domain-containing protein [uncultured Mucilaginibacter sp.]|uniref:PKD domain-containing protein n=1 Tax=uncultured Mucilaginibacter sp. TaxID=797541 RepID=UPI0025D001DF|nr:PKD domain-containing protein [uncultured Mucilaginibacter sp.]
MCSCLTAFAQSNKGTEFYTAWMDHVDGATGEIPSRMNLYLVSTINTSGTVSIADNSFAPINFTLTANEPQTIAIPASAFLVESTNDSTLRKGIHIVSGYPISAFAHIYRGSVSGATLLLPVNSMGKEYFSINYTQVSNSNIPGGNNSEKIKPSYSAFNVIATEDATTVEITPKAALISGRPAGVKFQVLLNKGEVYQGLSSSDLTGSSIRSVSSGTTLCKKIVVFSGSSKIGIGCNGNLNTGNISATSDNLFQQVYPTETWGKNYYAVPLKERNYDIFRVIFSDAATKATKDGVPIPTPANGYYEFKTQTPVVVKADKPIQLVQYTPSQNETINCSSSNNDTGDPEMIFLPPIEQGLRQVTVYSPSEAAIRSNKSFINVVIPTNAVSTFKIDGQAYAGFSAMPNDAKYSYAQINVGFGKHSLSAGSTFNAIAYGFGPAESYGYAAGINLQNLNEYIDLGVPGVSASSLTNGCANVNYSVQLVVPFPSLSFITWRFSDGATVTNQSPQYAATRLAADGSTLYVYRYNGILKKAAGYYGIIATIPNQGSTSGCGPTRDIEFNYNIADYPEAKFGTSTNNCLGTATQFVDSTDAKGSLITTWLWNFGDSHSSSTNPNISTEQNPSHTYTVPGDYKVTLITVNENGCNSDVKEGKVHINALPQAKFEAVLPNCQMQAVTFQDKSTSVDGKIIQWAWDFGDANSTAANPNFSTAQSASHTYTAAGVYTVKLIVTSVTGCKSEVFSKLIKINPSPIVDFVLPDACQLDMVKFENKTTIADGSESLFTYEWDFGDGSAKTFTKDGLHQYSAPGVYMVKLKVASKDGCVSITEPKQFTLNGIRPKAIFNIANKEICSSETLVIENQSYVSGGNIIRYDVYYDYINHPNDFVTYDAASNSIPADKLFKHNYGLSTVTKDYKIRIVVYTGSSTDCQDIFLDDVKIKANPVVAIAKKNYITCQEATAFNLETNEGAFIGLGTPAFTGAGITNSASGLFDPKTAGPGTHTIHYVFILNSTGCIYEDDITIVVNPTPIINGKRNYTVREGEGVTLQPQVLSLNRSRIKYTWMPKQGLSNSNADSPTASPGIDTDYMLTVESEDGCSASAIFTVKVLQQPVVYNTFTPNGDGRNDTWVIPFMSDYPKATVEVFNRNGEKVFNSIGYPVPWDGRYRGADLPAGTYYYLIDLKNGKPAQSGPLTIIR